MDTGGVIKRNAQPRLWPSRKAGGVLACGAYAVANDEDQCYAMLQRRPGETLQQLLERLDAAIDTAITTEEMIDEINALGSKPHKASRRY